VNVKQIEAKTKQSTKNKNTTLFCVIRNSFIGLLGGVGKDEEAAYLAILE
jgi:hypothetical protein